MEEIIVKSQAELDAIPVDFGGRIIIKFGEPYNRAIIKRNPLPGEAARKAEKAISKLRFAYPAQLPHLQCYCSTEMEIRQ